MYFVTPIVERLSASHLDRELAAGADPDSSPALRHRAEALAKPSFRAELAEGLRDRVRAARQPRRGASASVPVCSRTVRGAATELEELARDIATAPEPEARGLALTRLLLVDGTGPLYSPGRDQGLLTAVRDAQRALGSRERV